MKKLNLISRRKRTVEGAVVDGAEEEEEGEEEVEVGGEEEGEGEGRPEAVPPLPPHPSLHILIKFYNQRKKYRVGHLSMC